MENFIKKLITSREGVKGSEIVVLGQRVQVINSVFFASLTEEFIDRDEKELLYELSKNSIKDFVRKIKHQQNLEENEMRKFMERLSASAGWGDPYLEKISQNPFEASYTVETPPISPLVDREGENDIIWSGLVTGALEEIYNVELESEETQCISEGAGKCRLKIKEVN